MIVAYRLHACTVELLYCRPIAECAVELMRIVRFLYQWKHDCLFSRLQNFVTIAF